MIQIKIQDSIALSHKFQRDFFVNHLASGLFTAQRNWKHARRFLEHYEFILVLEGEVFLQEDKKQYTVSEGDILILSPYKVSFGFKEGDKKTSFYWIRFATNNFEALEIESNPFKTAEAYKLKNLVKQLLLVTQSPEYPQYTADLWLTLLLNELSILQRNSTQNALGLVKKISEWVGMNIHTRITTETVSDTFGYNRDYLSRIFKAALNVGLKEFINGEKIKYAKSLLLTSNYNVKQVGEILGYEDENLFVKFFKYHEGVSPEKFRKIYLLP